MNSLQPSNCNPTYRGLYLTVPHIKEKHDKEAGFPLELPPCYETSNCVATGENNPSRTFSPIEIPRTVSHNSALRAVNAAMEQILWQDLYVPYSIFGSKRIRVVKIESNKLVYEYQTFLGTTSDIKVKIDDTGKKAGIKVRIEREGGDSSSLADHLFLYDTLFSRATAFLQEKAREM